MKKDAKDYRILIVDDMPDNIYLLANVLTNRGYQVEYVTNGKDAVEWVFEEDFDLVLLDVMMPGINGFEVCRLLKSIESKAAIPVIFLTAATDVESIAKGFESGGADYITKPFNEKELLARVQTHTELKSYRDSLIESNEWLENIVDQRTKDLGDASLELRKIKMVMDELDQTKVEFLQIINQHLRAPLNNISASIFMLSREDFPESAKKFMNILTNSVAQLEKLSLTALYLSELRIKNVKIAKRNEYVAILVRNAVDKYADDLKKKKITITTEIRKEDIMLPVHAEYFDICIEKIIHNSIQYCESGSNISIKVTDTDQFVDILIKDNGQGFSEKALRNIFKPFISGEKNNLHGSGLGLYLAKTIVEAHNAEISAGNNSDGGAYVLVRFPKIKELN